MQETEKTWVWSLHWEDPVKKGRATHFSILAWGIPWTEEPGGLQSIALQARDQTQVSHIAGRFFTSWAPREAGLQRVGQDWSNLARSHTHTHTHTQLLNSVVLVSDVQPSDSVTHIHVSILCEALSPFRLFQNTEQSSLCFQWVFVGYPFKIVFIKSGSKTPSL